MKANGAGSRARRTATGRRFAIVAARFYPEIAEQLLKGAKEALRACNVADDHVSRAMTFRAVSKFRWPAGT